MKPKLPRPLDRTRDELIGTVVHFGVSVTQVRQRASNQDVILLCIEQPMPHVPITTPLLELISGNPRIYQGPAFIPEESDEWTRPWRNAPPIFNCHAYSLGKRIGLTPKDWVEGEPTNLSMDTNPADILLSTYFRLIRTLAADQTSILEKDARLREGDVVSFTRKRYHWGTAHEHSGKVHRIGGKNWLMSKFKSGRLLLTPIAEALELYPQTETLHVYRFLGT